MLRIAIQNKGRLNDDSMRLLQESGISVKSDKRKFLAEAKNFPVELLFLRDDDIPQTVAMGVADVGIVGLNEVKERGYTVDVLQRLGFGACRISLAIPKAEEYNGLTYFNGKRVATSYPAILRRYFDENGIAADIHIIAGSVEIAPSSGLADAIFDIVSSGSTLVSNGLKEVERVIESEAVLIGCQQMDAEKRAIVDKLMFRFEAVQRGASRKYLLMNLPTASLDKVAEILPAMRSPTVMPLAIEGWSAVHSVVLEDELWDKIDMLKAIGAEGILVLPVEKIIL